jgi:hypothetical protein
MDQIKVHIVVTNYLLTSTGYWDLSHLQGTHVSVWNGTDFVETQIVHTECHKPTIQVGVSSGLPTGSMMHIVHCTPTTHVCTMRNGQLDQTWIDIHDTQTGDVLAPFEYPVIESGIDQEPTRRESLFHYKEIEFEGYEPPLHSALDIKVSWLNDFMDRYGTSIERAGQTHVQFDFDDLGYEEWFVEHLAYLLQTLGVAPNVIKKQDHGHHPGRGCTICNSISSYSLILSMKHVEQLGWNERIRSLVHNMNVHAHNRNENAMNLSISWYRETMNDQTSMNQVVFADHVPWEQRRFVINGVLLLLKETEQCAQLKRC